mgnify:CR=1 FL=1|tara:strand:- start:24 stop:464 length:441 start_codon:yes stop_codon:yes gene_type:complete
MSYIKVVGNIVTVAGMVHPNPSDTSWFEYNGSFPSGGRLLWSEEEGVIVVDEEFERESVRIAAKAARQAALDMLTYTFEDGNTIQVRPQDHSFLSLAIQLGNPIDWVMEDDTVRLTSTQELTEALNSGVQQGVSIWSTYTEVLKDV